MKIALLHCYSATNLGDGLLVEEAIELLHDAFGVSIEITIVASYPETFAFLDYKKVRSRPTLRGYDRDYLRLLRGLQTYDLVVGVGGGYLRFGSFKESAKTALVMLPQLVAAAVRARRSIYLPQSVGPSPELLRGVLSRAMSHIDLFLVRDDRSLNEFQSAGLTRFPDLALLTTEKRRRDSRLVDPVPVYSIRALQGEVLDSLLKLGERLGDFTGYIQSRGAGNDDTGAMERLHAKRMIERQELFAADGVRRVVIAVRLHAAVMAINAGHYVVHLAYERKGFGAFQDLDLEEYVHSVRAFDVEKVVYQVRQLRTEPRIREAYDERLHRSFTRFSQQREELIGAIRGLSSP